LDWQFNIPKWLYYWNYNLLMYYYWVSLDLSFSLSGVSCITNVCVCVMYNKCVCVSCITNVCVCVMYNKCVCVMYNKWRLLLLLYYELIMFILGGFARGYFGGKGLANDCPIHNLTYKPDQWFVLFSISCQFIVC